MTASELDALAQARSMREAAKASRDARILKLAAEGLTPLEIARRVGVAPTTVTRIAGAACTRRRDTCLPLGLPAV